MPVLLDYVHHWKKNILKSVNGILLPRLFSPKVRKKCSIDREKILKFVAEGWELAKILKSWRSKKKEQLQFKLEKIIGI